MEDKLECLEKARCGDEKSFARLVNQYEGQVYATALGMLGETNTAKDVTQEVFIRFYKAIKTFRGDARISTYLSRIAINLSINELNKRKRRRWLSLQRDLPHLELSDHSAAAEQQELRDSLKKALQTLTPEFRAVVVLRLVDGYSVQETAEILNVPQGTVASRLARAQKKLQQTLKQWL
jgi:RNA polymerase sigma-70 factor (ECF subfamily)